MLVDFKYIFNLILIFLAFFEQKIVSLFDAEFACFAFALYAYCGHIILAALTYI